MNICIIDTENHIVLASVFNVISTLKEKTGFGLEHVYEWLNLDITQPEEGDEWYRWEDASADFDLFRADPEKFIKKIPFNIASDFFSVCENFKIYFGETAKNSTASIERPILAKSESRVYAQDFKRFVDKEKDRTDISFGIIWKLLPADIQSKYKINSYIATMRSCSDTNTIGRDLAEAIHSIYSNIPGRYQPIGDKEGLVVPSFAYKHSFSICSKVAYRQLNEKLACIKENGPYKSKKYFFEKASELLQVNVEKSFDQSRPVATRLRVAICLALLDGHTIPQEVLDVHHSMLEKARSMRPVNRPTQDIGSLINE